MAQHIRSHKMIGVVAGYFREIRHTSKSAAVAARPSRDGLQPRPPTRDRRGCREPAQSGQSGGAGAQRIDFLVGGKPPGLFFREQQPTVDGDLEYSSHPRHQLDFGAVKLDQPRPRTEGPRFIVSRFAPLDSHLHRRLSLSQELPAIALTKLARSRGTRQPCRDIRAGASCEDRCCWRRRADAEPPSGLASGASGVALGGGRRQGLGQSREIDGACGKIVGTEADRAADNDSATTACHNRRRPGFGCFCE